MASDSQKISTPSIGFLKFKDIGNDDTEDLPVSEADKNIILNYLTTNFGNGDYLQNISVINNDWILVNFKHWPETSRACREFKKTLKQTNIKLFIDNDDADVFWVATIIQDETDVDTEEKIIKSIQSSIDKHPVLKNHSELIYKLLDSARNHNVVIKIDTVNNENKSISYKLHFEKTNLDIEAAFLQSMDIFWDLIN